MFDYAFTNLLLSCYEMKKANTDVFARALRALLWTLMHDAGMYHATVHTFKSLAVTGLE